MWNNDGLLIWVELNGVTVKISYFMEVKFTDHCNVFGF